MIRLSESAARPLRTLDPAAPLDDLDWLDDAIGDARVVAIGESAHYNREFAVLRHRLLRYLVERHGFRAYAMENGLVEGALVDAWVRGGPAELGRVQADGISSMLGLWTQIRDQLTWLRAHNQTAAQPVGCYGIDVPGSTVSLLPGLDAVLAYLADADPDYQPNPDIRETAATFAASNFFAAPTAIAAYQALSPAARDTVTAGLATLHTRLTSRRLDYRHRTTPDAYDRALHALRLTIALDAGWRGLPHGDRGELMYARDAAIADTVEWILGREDRVVLAAHNGHIQRRATALPGMPATTPMGAHLADRLGADYLVIGTTSGTGQALNTGPDFATGTLFAPLTPPQPGSLDALLHASHDGPFAVDLRRLSTSDTETVRSVTTQRAGIGEFYLEQRPLEAFDLVVHLPHVTPADPDPDALAHAHPDIQQVFAAWSAQVASAEVDQPANLD